MPAKKTLLLAFWVSLGWTCPLLGVPPLTARQLQQLSYAREGGPLVDEPAFYPLMQNALKWSSTAADEATATVPSYQAIITAPKQSRGKLFLIEGDLLRCSDPGTFALPGPWEGKWRQWAVQWGQESGQLAVVYLVDPPQDPVITANAHPKVRLPARFFKMWEDVDQEGYITQYMVFVGSSAKVLWQPAVMDLPSTSRSKQQVDRMILGGVIAIMAAVFLYFRKRLTAKAKPLTVQEHLAHDLRGPVSLPSSKQSDGISNTGEKSRHDLPADPAQALEILENESHGRSSDGSSW